jgi:hypothetical protein
MPTARTSLTPNPPNFFGLQMVSHLAQLIRFLQFLLPHKNSLWILRTFFHTRIGILIKERKKMGMEFNTAFRRTIQTTYWNCFI